MSGTQRARGIFGVAESRYELVRNWNIPEFEIVK
jgi:hypothetical protein